VSGRYERVEATVPEAYWRARQTLSFPARSARTSGTSSVGIAISVTSSSSRGLDVGKLLILGLIVIKSDEFLDPFFIPARGKSLLFHFGCRRRNAFFQLALADVFGQGLDGSLSPTVGGDTLTDVLAKLTMKGGWDDDDREGSHEDARHWEPRVEGREEHTRTLPCASEDINLISAGTMPRAGSWFSMSVFTRGWRELHRAASARNCITRLLL
jgi:hypothetical protein